MVAPSVLGAILVASPAAALVSTLLVERKPRTPPFRLRARCRWWRPPTATSNALSDASGLGGRPVLALTLLGIPVATVPVATVQRILAGDAAVCTAAGTPVAGDHSIDAPEPIYGLTALRTECCATSAHGPATPWW